MSIILDRWREEFRVFNSHGLVRLYHEENPVSDPANAAPVYIAFSSNDGSRMNMGALTGWYVISPEFQTDPGSHWTDHGNMAFSAHLHSQANDLREARMYALRAAQEWCNLKYGTTEWGSIPGFGRDRFPIEIVKWAKRKIQGR
jgi:hypothetical protein